MNVSLESINRDLTTYKARCSWLLQQLPASKSGSSLHVSQQGVLSKLNAAKDLIKEFIERDKRKQKERGAAHTEAVKSAGAPVGRFRADLCSLCRGCCPS